MQKNGDAEKVFRAVRRIVRAVDLRSRAVTRLTGLTLPQLVMLNAVEELGEVTTRALSERAELSSATVVTILDKLEAKGLVTRYRSCADRRIVHTALTEAGSAVLSSAPSLLGDGFESAFAALPAEERRALSEAAARLAGMIGETCPAGEPGGLLDRAPPGGPPLI